MRRLLAAFVTVGLALCLSLGLAAPALAGGRLPAGITSVGVTLSFPLKSGTGSHRPVHRTFTRAATVSEIVGATDTLRTAPGHVVCPMFVRVGPVLAVVFRNRAGRAVAQAQVQVVQGSRGQSGSSPCFPIRLVGSGREANLLGNSWVRMMGRLIGVRIS